MGVNRKANGAMLKTMLKSKNLKEEDLAKAKSLLRAVILSDEYKPYTREYACAFEVIIHLYENNPEKVVETAMVIAKFPSADLLTIQSQIYGLCKDYEFKQEYKLLFAKRSNSS